MLKRSLLTFLALLALQFNAGAQTFQNRKALIIGLSNYSAQSQADPLLGVPHDIESAKKIASAMGIPENSLLKGKQSKDISQYAYSLKT
jgi:hypothetical protein